LKWEEIMGAMETFDYTAIIADLEAKRAALDATITAFRAAQAAGALGQPGEATVGTLAVPFAASGGEVPVGAFLGRSIPEAARLCLQIVKRKMSSREIAEALKKGGIESTAKNFATIVHSILDRASKGNSGIVKLNSSWGLAEWYPASLRSSGTVEKRPKGKRGRKPKVKASLSTAPPIKTESGSPDGLQHRIVKLLHTKPGAEFAPSEIASALGVRVQTIHFILGKLAFRKQAEKTTEGKYKSIAA
jgi:hypothetical protein